MQVPLPTQIIHYSQDEFRFKELVEAQIGLGPLPELHTVLKPVAMLKAGSTDQATAFHDRCYEDKTDFRLRFTQTYLRFLRKVVQPLFNGEPLIYQIYPTFRCHLVGNVGVGEFHADGQYGHLDCETNILVPLTPAYETNTIWLESAPQLGDYTQQRMWVGDALAFGGAVLRHGNKVNETKHTRVSFDFRVIPVSKFPSRLKSTVSANTQRAFNLGGYFGLLDVPTV